LIGAEAQTLASGETKRAPFVRLGMPVRVERGCFWAHKDNIDEWFRRFTYCTIRDAPEDVE